MRIFITGDTHGDIDWSKLNTTQFPVQKELTKSDYVIITGDFGAVWNGDRSDKYLQKNYNERNFTTLFVDGNHENFDLLNSYPVEMWNGGKIHRISDSIIHLMRGQVFTMGDKTFFTMGGASSTDKFRRREHISWWADEIPSKEELEEGINNLEKVDFNVDYVLSHCCGTSLLSQILFSYDSDTLTSYFDHLEFDFNLQFKHWYFGHYHRDKDIDNKYHCMYNRIIEL